MIEISVVVPVYKGKGCLPELYRRLVEILEPLVPVFELVLVEDRGGDGSWELIEALASQDSRVIGLQLARNFGQHAAITAGLDVAEGEWVVVMDCDLQDRPEEIARLYAKARVGFEVVVARRGHRKDSWCKRTTSKLFYRAFTSLAGIPMDSQVGNFRIVSRKVADTFRTMHETTRFFSGMVEWMGFPTASIDVAHDARFAGETTYTYRKLLALAFNVIIAYSDKPLWMSIKLGFGISGISVLGGCYLIVRYLHQGVPVAGWTSLMFSLYFLGGVIISLLGIIGVYLGKVFDGVKNRPLYIVGSRTR